MKVFVAGPVDWWWNENWRTPEHVAYMEWREHITTLLIEAGHLVYRPDRSWKGAWVEDAQVVNDKALEICDVFVYLTPPNVPAPGTEAETEYARTLGKRVEHVPPGNTTNVEDLIVPLPDPYGSVTRKTNKKEK